MKILIINHNKKYETNNYTKEDIKEMINNYVDVLDNVKVICDNSKSGKSLKGLKVYYIGSKSMIYYIDLFDKFIYKINRHKIIGCFDVVTGEVVKGNNILWTYNDNLVMFK